MIQSVELNIRALRPEDQVHWLPLWRGYLEFYKHEQTEDQTQMAFDRLIAADQTLNALVAELDGKLIGLAHYFWTPSTWIEHKDLYLEDLFVDPEHRASGVARQLIHAVVEICKSKGGSKVHWQTHKDNDVARALYEKLGTLSEFVVYEIKL